MLLQVAEIDKKENEMVLKISSKKDGIPFHWEFHLKRLDAEQVSYSVAVQSLLSTD